MVSNIGRSCITMIQGFPFIVYFAKWRQYVCCDHLPFYDQVKWIIGKRDFSPTSIPTATASFVNVFFLTLFSLKMGRINSVQNG